MNGAYVCAQIQTHEQRFLCQILFRVQMQEEKELMTGEMQDLLEFSEAMGVLKFVNNKTIENFKLAFDPMITTSQYYETLGKYQLIWNKLFFKISQDRKFITNLMEPLRKNDQMIKHFLDIYDKTEGKGKTDGIAFTRCDYYNDLVGDPKLTEYNLFSLGMQSNQEMFQQAKKMTDPKDKVTYAATQTIKSFSQTVQDFMTKKNLSGLFLFVIIPNDANLFDQKRLQIMLMKHNVRVKRVTIQEMVKNITKDEKNDIFFKGELVSIVYYRAGYRFGHFECNGDPEAGWRTKQQIELSNAYTLPPVVMELVNQKRVQTELTKPEVLRKFLSNDEAQQLQKTYVKQWQFDSLNEDQYLDLISTVEKDPEWFILKPNLQGGGNNFYGLDALNKMKALTLQECRVYILMEKIRSKASENHIMDGVNYQTVNCLYEISRLGTFSWIGNELNKNTVSGFLLRAKPEDANEGGIMTGIGSIVPWKLIND